MSWILGVVEKEIGVCEVCGKVHEVTIDDDGAMIVVPHDPAPNADKPYCEGSCQTPKALIGPLGERYTCEENFLNASAVMEEVEWVEDGCEDGEDDPDSANDINETEWALIVGLEEEEMAAEEAKNSV